MNKKRSFFGKRSIKTIFGTWTGRKWKKKMNIFLSMMIFIMGTFFGSFFTLAVYRIPLKKDITHEHSFCPNCGHKLGTLDLIPIFSYLFLRGKCRYCGEKVRIRYLLLEVLSGIVFLLAYLSFHIQNSSLESEKLISFIAFVFVYVTIVLVAGIDQERHKINSSILRFGMICQIVYIVYLYMIGMTSVYRYIIYLALFVLLEVIHKTKAKENYGVEILLLLVYIGFVLEKQIGLLVILLGSFVISLGIHLVAKKKYPKITQIPMGFTIGISTIVYIIVQNFIKFYIV